jgi:hypothetical protein
MLPILPILAGVELASNVMDLASQAAAVLKQSAPEDDSDEL